MPDYLLPGARRMVIAYGLLLILGVVGALWMNNPLVMALPVTALVAFVLLTDYRPLFYLLFLVTPLSIEAVFSESLSTDLPTEPLMLLLTGVLVGLLVFKRKELDWSGFKHPVVTLAGLQLLWIAVTTIFSVDHLVSVKWLAAKVWYLAAFGGITLLVVRKPKDFRPLFWCLYLPTFFIAIYVLVRHAQRDWSFAEVNLTMEPFFRNHVNYAVFLALMVPFLWMADRWYPRWSWPRMLINLGKPILLTAIYFSYTRSSWVSVVAAFLTYLLMRRGLLKIGASGALAALLISVGFLLHNNRYLDYAPEFSKTIYHDSFEKHMEATTSLQDVSSAERIYRWLAGWNMFVDKPITGFGPGNFYPHYQEHTVSSFYTYISRNEERSTVHNYYLMTLCEQGAPGLILFFALILAALFLAQNLYRRCPDRDSRAFCLALCASLVTILVNIFFSDLIEADKIGTMFWAILAMLVGLDLYVQRLENQRSGVSIDRT